MRLRLERHLSRLDDPHADDFFRQGDEGTYDGGPAHDTVAPVALPDVVSEDVPVEVVAAQLARRDRLRRMVTGFVGTLAGASVLVFAVRAMERVPAGSVEALPTTVAAAAAPRAETPPSPPAELAPAAAAEAPQDLATPPAVDPLPAEPAVTPVEAAPREAASAPARPVEEPAVAAAPPRRTAVARTVQRSEPARAASTATRIAPPIGAKATAAPVPDRAVAPPPRLDTHAPPTASFASFPD